MTLFTVATGESELLGSGYDPDWKPSAPVACTGDANCNDNNPCTDDSCDTDTGECSNSPVADGTVCGIDGWCESGFCVEPECQIDEDCDDFNDCTSNSCNGWMCQFDPRPGAICDDGDSCTTDDRCDGTGGCAGVSDPTIPGCGCLPKHAFCSADAECCSNKCRGGKCR